MEISDKKKPGRPKAATQTGPLVLSERRTRTKIELEINSEAAAELADYARWVEVSEGMSTAEATATTVEFALRNVFKRDRLWREQRRKADKQPTPAVTGPARPAPAAPPSPPPHAPSPARASVTPTPAATR
jgi:hypothetical protein